MRPRKPCPCSNILLMRCLHPESRVDGSYYLWHIIVPSKTLIRCCKWSYFVGAVDWQKLGLSFGFLSLPTEILLVSLPKTSQEIVGSKGGKLSREFRGISYPPPPRHLVISEGLLLWRALLSNEVHLSDIRHFNYLLMVQKDHFKPTYSIDASPKDAGVQLCCLVIGFWWSIWREYLSRRAT